MKLEPYLLAFNKYKDLKLQQKQQQKVIFIYLVRVNPVNLFGPRMIFKNKQE